MRGLGVIDPGLLTTIQDRGRPGFAHLGVPHSGALDQQALALGNRLVGNPADAAALEITLTGCTLRARDALVVAVTGAFAEVAVDGRAQPWGSRIVVPDGATLSVGPARYGARSMIAVAGGVTADRVLGSRSRDTLSGIGPRPLVLDEHVPVGLARPSPDGVVEAPFDMPRRHIGLLPGPHASTCDPAQLAQMWRVGGDSNRVGLRLEGPVMDRSDGEIRSFPMIGGAVQLPPSGQPIILLADHATTGGYPVVAVVAPEDLDACAQWRPGDEITMYWR